MIKCDFGLLEIKGLKPVLYAELETILIKFINDDEFCGLQKLKEIFNQAVEDAPEQREIMNALRKSEKSKTREDLSDDEVSKLLDVLLVSRGDE